jgi:mono/diheme cytochrome c family protein
VKRALERAAASGAVALLALGAGGCTALDNALASVPFLSFMQASPAIGPYENPRLGAPGAIPYSSPAGQVFPELQPTEASLQAFGASHPNPVPMTDTAALATGQALFQRYCFVCHGPEGKGNGPILNKPGEMGKFPYAPNLTLPITAARPDGYIFGIITVGRGLMPEYGSKIPAAQRWDVVNYVRQLERQAGAAPAGGAPAAAPTPAPTTTTR